MEVKNKSPYLEIAEEIGIGQTCYYNKVTNEYFFIPETDDLDKDLFAEDLAKIKKDKKDLIIIRQPKSNITFKLMEEFIDGVDDFEIQSELIESISYEKPFANFKQKTRKYKIEGEWCSFRDAKYAALVEAEVLAGS